MEQSWSAALGDRAHDLPKGPGGGGDDIYHLKQKALWDFSFFARLSDFFDATSQNRPKPGEGVAGVSQQPHHYAPTVGFGWF